MFDRYIDCDSLGNETVIEIVRIGGLEPDMQANTFEMTDEVKDALQNGNDGKLYSLMWDIYNENNSCVAWQSFKNWIDESDYKDARRIQKVMNRIERKHIGYFSKIISSITNELFGFSYFQKIIIMKTGNSTKC